jgi:hypothetical protein
MERMTSASRCWISEGDQLLLDVPMSLLLLADFLRRPVGNAQVPRIPDEVRREPARAAFQRDGTTCGFLSPLSRCEPR